MSSHHAARPAQADRPHSAEEPGKPPKSATALPLSSTMPLREAVVYEAVGDTFRKEGLLKMAWHKLPGYAQLQLRTRLIANLRLRVPSPARASCGRLMVTSQLAQPW